MMYASILRPASHSIAIGAVLLVLLRFAAGCRESTWNPSIRHSAGDTEAYVSSDPVSSSVDIPDLHEIGGDWQFVDVTIQAGLHHAGEFRTAARSMILTVTVRPTY
ncbi:MAG: hypothetical protein KDB11_34065 [Planctomycetales bacterium]|nr:hypothetical protein [Planctomycetales bacterium]